MHVLHRAQDPGSGTHADSNEVLRRAGAVGIAVEAGETVLLQRERALATADAAGLVVLGVGKPPEQTLPPSGADA